MSEALDLSPMDTPESPASGYSTSPSQSPKRDGLIFEPSEEGNTISSCLRLLVSNAAAGSVIGKGGSTVSDLQTQSGARIQLSRNREFFPGTTDRIILVTGTINEILIAANLILQKLLIVGDDNDDVDEKTSQVRLVLPNSVCGGIIGKGGATVKSFIEDSQANIKLSSQDQILPGVSDRLVTITGTLEQQLRAIFLIVSKLSEDPNYTQYANAPLSYTGGSVAGMQGITGGYTPVGYGLPNYGSSVYGVNARNNKSLVEAGHNALDISGYFLWKGLMAPLVAPRSPLPIGLPLVATGAHTSFKMAVPDERVGAIVGRGGRTIIEIQQVSGAKIKISDRGDFISGTNDRQVTISGAIEAVQLAQNMVEQRLSSDLER